MQEFPWRNWPTISPSVQQELEEGFKLASTNDTRKVEIPSRKRNSILEPRHNSCRKSRIQTPIHLCSVECSPVSVPPRLSWGTSKSTAVLQCRHRSVNMVMRKILMKTSWLVVSIYWQIQSKSFKQEV